ncbi:MAG TPA: hypothetical protein DCY48_00250 [Candidatus Magasanikbacteria bacterium]|nr:MAG: hypothetical protein A3I74_01715 [Candidatus Magasanikbacteria bacterium RIFCSPLOWO2_02_FULL_47_16]OGH79874.1 MAG: hypothetical protein A3C10_00215 [Candidatus Magasanikbacteria bacterium RIFCSPHIGHO2_02_FULL_48_18]OGH82246.1 MAG: hypothetical protein A3G08_00190 [Candidatus Magasanikbacteria bacterium RIFCSPLOWO2_12_FULL_47_9b]HAZ28198.1 hypothetical protein [Candidatus Magasanikbacteria bacterium]
MLPTTQGNSLPPALRPNTPSSLGQSDMLHSANAQAGQSVEETASMGPSTSIFRKSNDKALSSIHHVNDASNGRLHSVYEQTDPSRRRGEDTADERRYTYIRRLIKERQANEKEAERRSGHGIAGERGAVSHVPGGVSKIQQRVTTVKTGAGFRKMLYTKAVRKMFLDKRAQYKNISMKDRNFFIGLVERYAKNKSVGHGMSRINRMAMRMDVERARRKGEISYEDARDFKKLIDQM